MNSKTLVSLEIRYWIDSNQLHVDFSRFIFCPRPSTVLNSDDCLLMTESTSELTQWLGPKATGVRNFFVEFLNSNGEVLDARMKFELPAGMSSKGRALKPTRQTVRHMLPFHVIENNCGGNVYMNLSSFEKISRQKLHVVCGKFGVRTHTGKIWWEWGAGCTSAQDFMDTSVGGGKNVHFWLEDDSGRIYDILSLYLMNIVCKVHRARIKTDDLWCGCLVMGFTIQEAEEIGLFYRRARQDVVEEVVQKTKHRLRQVQRYANGES